LAFGGLIFTNAGLELQAKVESGKELKFLRISVGDGELNTSIPDLTSVINEVMSLDINSINIEANTAVIKSIFSNSVVSTAFYWREIGIIAQDPDTLQEILYCYGNAGNNAEYIPVGGGADVIERILNIPITVGNASNVTAQIVSGIYPTWDDVYNLIEQSGTLKFKGYIMTTQPTNPHANEMWINSDVLPTTFPISKDIIRIYDGTTWQLATADYQDKVFDLWAFTDGHGYYRFDDAWNVLDFTIDMTQYYTREEIDNTTGSLTSLTTSDKSNIVNAINEVNGGRVYYGEAEGVNDYTVTIEGITSYYNGLTIAIRIPTTSTSFCHLNINGLGSSYLVNETASTLTAGELRQHGIYIFVYRDSSFRLTGKSAVATTTLNGLMSSTDKTKLDGLNGNGKKSATFIIGQTGNGYDTSQCDYVCDGTADDVEINAAIQALPLTGGKIIIREGNYKITSNINVNKGNVTIEGMGSSTVLTRMYDGSSNNGLIYISSSFNTIKDITIDGNKSAYTSTTNYSIHLTNGDNNTITENTCNNNGGRGIHLANSDNNTITGNTCNNNNYGIYLNSSNNNTITGNTCYTNANYGIYLNGSDNNTITENTCYNNNNYSIYLANSTNNTITGNTCNNNDNGIYLTGGTNNTITGNTCNNNNNNGIYLNSSNNNTIAANTCIRGEGLSSDYTSSQSTIKLNVNSNNYNLIANNNIMGKNYSTGGGTNNTFDNNKYN
jgi:parallel beta-helix repeat protein